MKRKIFSKLLMGAILFASVSAFVSCKDYDDDINANKADIKAAQEQLATLTSNLTSLQQKLETEKAALQQELATAKSQLETQIADAKAQLNDAIAKKADQTTVDALVTRIANLETDLAATKEAFNAKIEAINNAISKLEALIEKKADQTYVDQAIATLTAAISGKVSTEDFNAFKAEVAKIETNLSNLTTLVNTKADQATVDAAFAAVNKEIAQLQEKFEAALAQQKKDFDAAVAQLNEKIATKADKSALDALAEKVNGLSDAVAALQAAVATKAEKAEVDALSKKLDEKVADLQDQINKLVTPEQLQAAVTKLENAIAALESATNAKIDLLKSETEKELQKKANQADFSELKAAFEALKASYERHGENIALMISDAINALDSKLTAIIDTKVDQDEFDTTVEAIYGEIDEVNEDIADILETLVAVNGDINDLDANIKAVAGKSKEVDSVLNSLITNNAIAIEALDIQVAAIEDFLADFLEEDGSASSLKEIFENASQEVKDSLEKQNAYRAAAIAEIGKKISALRTELQDTIDSNAASIADLQEKFGKISEIIDARIAENINNLTVFVSKSLKSISLVPQLFIDGVEAIEFNSLVYTEVQPGTSGHNFVAKASPVTIDNGTAEAYYRLNPSIVDRASLDESNIDFLAATSDFANQFTTRAATVASPVKFNGIAEWNYKGQKGLIKVNLKKNVSGSLNDTGKDGGDFYIVALKVPRKATKISGVDVEAADIVSENSRLVEYTKTPKIARLTWNAKGSERLKWYDPISGDYPELGYNVHHYTDSATIWQQYVDNDELVYHKINYNETFDVSKIVTGCDLETPVDYALHAGIDKINEGAHAASHQLSKELLKSYGIAFRYYIPTTPYDKPITNDVDHFTDQQQFAEIDVNTGILKSKLPQNAGYDNRACVGKEPIIRVDLVDTVKNKLLDQRYLKIKWVEKTLEPKYLGEFKKESTLKPCEDNVAPGITWVEFINKVYAVIGDNGISQKTFEKVYYTEPVTYSTVAMTWADGKAASHLSLLSAAILPGNPQVEPTFNEHGDALIANWTLTPAEIANIYPKLSKTFKSTITFHSILPTEYPDLTMDYIWTIKLPELPVINGYYDNYWFTKYSLHDVMPVQYNSDMYKKIAAGTVVPQGGTLETYANSNGKYHPWIDYNGNQAGYCVFYNNLMNAFTYEQDANKNPLFIVKNIGKPCGTWDMQFTWPGPDAVEQFSLWNSATNKWNPTNKNVVTGTVDAKVASALYTGDDQNQRNYTQFAFGNNQYVPGSQTNSPSLSYGMEWENAGAYRLVNNVNAQALQLVWDEGHTEWCGNIAHKQAILYADHNNPVNQLLINPIVPKGIGVEPDRTHEKKVHMGVWGTLNDWNIVAVKDYDICLVEPLAINAKLDGAFEEGYVSGTAVSCDDAFTMTDFRGYEVKNVAPAANAGEFVKFRQQLYKYYEVGEPKWNLNAVRYGFSWNGNDVVQNDNLNYDGAMTAADIRRYTNDNIVLSVERKYWNGKWYLVFKNNGGSNVEEEVNVFIPVTVTYGFGSVTANAVVRLYPKGKVASGVTIVAYPGNN